MLAVVAGTTGSWERFRKTAILTCAEYNLHKGGRNRQRKNQGLAPTDVGAKVGPRTATSGYSLRPFAIQPSL